MKNQVKQTEHGFALVEALLILLVVGLLVGVGLWVFKQKTSNNSESGTVSTQQAKPQVNADVKTAQSFNDFAVSSGSDADKAADKAATNYASTSQSDAATVNKVGDSYNENSY